MPAKETVLHFGKHNGKRLADVPIGYLRWMLEKKFKRRLLEDVRIVLGLKPEPVPIAYGPHPVPDDVILDPMEECPFVVDDPMPELDREFKSIVG